MHFDILSVSVSAYSRREDARRSSVARASAVLRPLVDLARRVGGWVAPRPADWSYLPEPNPGVALSFAGNSRSASKHCRPLPPAAAACLLDPNHDLRFAARSRAMSQDVGACRDRRFAQYVSPEKMTRSSISDRGGAAPAVPVENRRTVCQPVHDAALTSGKCRCAVLSGIRPCSAFPAMLPGCNIVPKP
jgi:hypothetical protein